MVLHSSGNALGQIVTLTNRKTIFNSESCRRREEEGEVSWQGSWVWDHWWREARCCTSGPSLFQRKSRRQLAGEEKVRERNAAGLRQGAKSRTSNILRKLCQSPSNILKRIMGKMGAWVWKKPVSHWGWLAAVGTSMSWTPTITSWGFNVLWFY